MTDEYLNVNTDIESLEDRIDVLEEEMDKLTEVVKTITDYINRNISNEGYIVDGGSEYIRMPNKKKVK